MIVLLATYVYVSVMNYLDRLKISVTSSVCDQVKGVYEWPSLLSHNTDNELSSYLL